MEDTLVRIRSQAVSKLDNQKQVAITLQVVEATLASKGQELIPSAYAALLLTLLEQDEGSNRPSLMYLLNVVFKELPESLLRAKFEEFIRIFFVVLNEDSEKASIIKSAIGCFEVLLKAQDKNSWSHPKVKEAFQYLLGLCADQRPKVRRGAQDAVCSILNSSKSAVGVVIVTDFCLNQLKRIRKTSANSASNEAVPFLSFLKQVSIHWTPQDLQRLNGPLMSLTKLNNAFITTLVYQTMATVIAQLDPAQLETLIETIIVAKPNYNETESFSAWLVSIKEGFSGLFSKSPLRFFSALPALLELLLKDLEGANKAVNACIGESMSELILSFNMDGLDAMEVAQVVDLDRLLRMLQDSLTYRFRNAWPQLFRMLQSLYKVFGASQPQSVIATLEILDAMRHEDGFEFKAEVDRALGAAIASLGPRQFLSILPLNLETPGEKTIGRAWLLPVLKEHINNTELSFFSKEMLSLADRLEARSKDYEAQGKAIEAKVYATLHHQIWSLFPSFASFPLELVCGFTDEFAERVANKIYSDAELRPILFNGLALLIESNRRLALDDELQLQQRYQIDQNAAQANLAHLSKFATNYLFVFFSIYSAASSNMRTLVLKVILTFLAISPADKIEAAFADVASRFDPNPSGEEATQTCAVMLDLAIVMIPYLQEASILKLLELSVHYLPGEFDGTLQKRAYKSMNKLLDTWQAIVLPQLGNIEGALLDAGMYTDSSAVKDRMNFLSKYIPLLPTSNLHVFSRLASEAILGGKEVNEKARESAFDVLVIMAQKMSEAGSPQLGANGETASSLEEFMNVVLAGLTGTTPHMISATISALSRLLFDFHKKLSPEKISELIETIELFVSSSNREIVKAALGFVKVVTVALEARHLQPHLGMLLNSILAWSNDNQSRFKVKVRHIIERLIRRFGMETVEAVFPEKHAKLIANIRRRKLRAKRQAKPAEKDEKAAVGKRTLGNAFDEALYGSESEIDSDDEDAQVAAPGLKRKANAMAASYIKEDKLDDAPIDFLDRGAISRISGHKPKKASDKLTTAFAMSNDGRLVFAEDSDSEKEAPAEAAKGEDFYKQSVDSKEGFTRVNNRIKFKKGQDKEEGSDTEMGSSKPNKRSKPAAPPRRNHGSEFKAKNADGDVKKKGKLDPYAYIPLNPKMMAKKGKNFSKVSILKKK